MRRKSVNWISILIVFVLLLTGIYLEEIKINSAFVCTPFDTSDSHNVAKDLIITYTPPCTAEMLGVSQRVSLDIIEYRFSNDRRDVKNTLNFLCLNFDLSNKLKSYSSCKKIQMVCKNKEQLIARYIHNSDGKKRI